MITCKTPKKKRTLRTPPGVNWKSKPVWLVSDYPFRRFESPTLAAMVLGINPVVVRNAKARAVKEGAPFFDTCGFRFALEEPPRPAPKPAPKLVAETLEAPVDASQKRKLSLLPGLCTHRMGPHQGGRW